MKSKVNKETSSDGVEKLHNQSSEARIKWKLFLNVERAAQLLGTSPLIVREYVREKRIQAVRVRGRVNLPQDELEQLRLETQKQVKRDLRKGHERSAEVLR